MNNEKIETIAFLRRERLDYVVKYFYIWARENVKYMTLAKDMYAKHIVAVTKGVCIEPDNIDKNTVDKYIESFETLMDSVKNTGLVMKNVSEFGAHRVACLVYFKNYVSITRREYEAFINANDVCFDYGFFLRSSFPRKYLIFADELYEALVKGEPDIEKLVYDLWGNNPTTSSEIHLFYMCKYFIRRKMVQTALIMKRIWPNCPILKNFQYRKSDNYGNG